MQPSFKTFVLLAVLALSLSACSLEEIQQAAVNAAYDGGKDASVQALALSPRLAGCGTGETQQLINLLRGQVDRTTATIQGVSMDTWLDRQAKQFGCIASSR